MIKMHDATLCYILGNGKVLLGMKKRGFGEGKWNGYGGKVRDETIEECVIRETFEETGIKILKLEKVGMFEFYFTNAPKGKSWDQVVHVYISREGEWTGEPKETEEMYPKWFPINEIPLKDMWSGDVYWLLKVLEGEKLKGSFVFGEDNNSVKSYKLQKASNL